MKPTYRITCDPGVFSDPAAFCIAQRYWPEVQLSFEAYEREEISRGEHHEFAKTCFAKHESGLKVHHMQRQKGLQPNDIADKIAKLYQDLLRRVEDDAIIEIYIDRGNVGISVVEECKALIPRDVKIIPIVIVGQGDTKFGYDNLKRDRVLTITRNTLLIQLQNFFSRQRIDLPDGNVKWVRELQAECTTLFTKFSQTSGNWTIAHRSKGSDDLAMSLAYAFASELLPLRGKVRSGAINVTGTESQPNESKISKPTKQPKRRTKARMNFNLLRR